MTKRYYLVDIDALSLILQAIQEGILMQDMYSGNEAKGLLRIGEHKIHQYIKSGVFVEHDTETDSYVIHNAAGMDEFLAGQREKGKSALK